MEAVTPHDNWDGTPHKHCSKVYMNYGFQLYNYKYSGGLIISGVNFILFSKSSFEFLCIESSDLRTQLYNLILLHLRADMTAYWEIIKSAMNDDNGDDDDNINNNSITLRLLLSFLREKRQM
jgi:hypothetical protein